MAGRHDPYAAFNFLVEIDGSTAGGFSECSGVSSETEVIEYRDGGEPLRMRKIPGLTKYNNVTLKRGYVPDPRLWEWRKRITDGQLDRRTVSILMLDQAGNVVLRWRLANAWPCKWVGPALNAASSDIAIETFELAVEQIDVEVA